MSAADDPKLLTSPNADRSPTRGGARRRSGAAAALLALGTLLLFTIFLALGTWQVHRRAWKLDLIARVEARIHGAPVPAPSRAAWPGVSAADDEYRRVAATGTFLAGHDTLVHALTERGAGYWVLAPLRSDAGDVVLINRGFVSLDHAPVIDPAGERRVTGLLRMSEPNTTVLRRNDPASDRWYERDLDAIAATRGIGPVAPYFIDADATNVAPDAPVGGLTVVSFPNNHLVYAITWYALAALVAATAVWRVWVSRIAPQPRTGRS